MRTCRRHICDRSNVEIESNSFYSYLSFSSATTAPTTTTTTIADDPYVASNPIPPMYQSSNPAQNHQGGLNGIMNTVYPSKTKCLPPVSTTPSTTVPTETKVVNHLITGSVPNALYSYLRRSKSITNSRQHGHRAAHAAVRLVVTRRSPGRNVNNQS